MVLLLTTIVELISAGLGPEDGKLIGGAAITQISGRSKARRYDAS